MNFEKKELLSYEELELLVQGDVYENITEQGDLIVNKIKSLCFYNYCSLYIYDKAMKLYKEVLSHSDHQIKAFITRYITTSKSNLTNEQKELFKYKYKNKLKNITSNNFYEKAKSQIITGITKDYEVFGADFYQIHFINGYIDLKTLEFKERTSDQYVKTYIPREYKASSKAQREELLKRIRKIYRDEKDLKAILYILGSALTGKAIHEQKILFLLGQGSAGKSKIMELTQEAFSVYFETLSNEAFSLSNKNADKTFSTFYKRPEIRMIWINEPKEDKMNKSTFKEFCEGKMKGKLLWENGEHPFNHNALPIFTANTMPNITMDTGVKRRIRGYYHTSKFTEDPKDVDEKNGIFLKDRDFLENIKKEGLLNAWIDILSEYANKYCKFESVEIPESFAKATEEMIEVNDHIQDFIDAKLEITNKGKENRIGKNEMLKLYKELYPNRYLTPQQIISVLKEKGIHYDKSVRNPIDGIRGCFIGVEYRTEAILDEGETKKPDPLDNGIKPIESEDTKAYKEMCAKYKELEEKYNKLLEKQEKKKKKKETKIKEKELTKEENLELFEDELDNFI